MHRPLKSLLHFELQFDVQKLRIYCDPEQNNRETVCEIPGFVSMIDELLRTTWHFFTNHCLKLT